jgi:hypothetical protein
MDREFKRVILKGDRRDWPLLLKAAELVQQYEGPMMGDGARIVPVRIGQRNFVARITKRSVFVEDHAARIRARSVVQPTERG